jgi:hypothetical protein
MNWIKRLAGVRELERRVDEMESTLAKLTERVAQLEGGVQPSTPYKCRDWKAGLDRTPGDQPALHVSGRCEFPTSGYTVRLQRHAPQGINPFDLLLDLIITEPTGPVSQVATEVNASYQEPTNVEFKSVTTLPNGPTVPVTTTT